MVKWQHINLTTIVILLIFGIPFYLFAQKISFEHILTKDGLSQGSVTSICQDSTGFIWFGTYDGLNRYDGYNFVVFKNDPKDQTTLSHSNIRSMLIDQAGTLWVGTSGGGLNRYNSKTETFTRYQHNPHDPNSISHDNIFELFQDRSGTIWIATWGGGMDKIVPLKQSDQHNNLTSSDRIKFVHFRHDPADPKTLASDKLTSFYEDKDGMIWIGTRYGVNKFNPKIEQFIGLYKHNPGDENSLSDDNISAVCGDRFGNIWIGTWGGGLNLFDPTKNQFYRFVNDSDNPRSISHNILMRLYSDRSGNMWIGTWGGGLNKVAFSHIEELKNGSEQYFERYQHRTNDTQSIIGNSIFSIFEDRSGVFWVGTTWNGLSWYNQDKAKFAHYRSDPDIPNGLQDNAVSTLFKDNKGTLWIGTYGGGLNTYNQKTNQFQHFSHDANNLNGLSSNGIRAIYKDQSGNMWFGTESGLNKYNQETRKFTHYYIDPNEPGATNINYIYGDKHGFLWLGNWGGGFAKFNPKTEEFTHYEYNPDDPFSIRGHIILCINEDKYGQLWIGTDQNGLNLFDRKNNRFYHYKHDENDSTTISSDKVITMMKSRKGDLWIGTGDGLNKMIYDNNTIKFENYTVNIAGKSNSVHGIMEDEHGNLWIIKKEHMLVTNPNTRETRIFDSYDHFQQNEFMDNSIYRDDKSGEMYIGGTNGFNIFHPDESKKNPFIPNIVINNLTIFNKPVHPGTTIDDKIILKKSIIETDIITLSYRENVFSFEFAALHFNSPSDNKYAYKMDGFDKNWNYVGNKREATYTNLDPGEYVFHVRGSNNDGIWNEKGTSIRVIITPPFWKTWWFRIFIVFLVIGIIFLIHKIRIKKIETHRRELELKVNERTHQLSEKTKALIIAKKDTDNILNNVNEGFFLLNKQHEISSQYSSALESIFSTKQIANVNLLDFFKNKIPEVEIKDLKDYLLILFDKRVEEDAIKDLNPLTDIEFTFPKEKDNNSVVKKYLNFNFKRIIADDHEIVELIVTVRDVTSQVLISKELEKEEARREKLLQLMLSILDVEPDMLNDFSESAQRELEFINKIMNHDTIDNYHKLLKKVFRSMHLIKGNAKLLNIDYFAQTAHQFEDMISGIQKKSKIAEEDINPLREKLRELQTGIDEMEKIIEKIGKVLTHKGRKIKADSRSLLKSLENLIDDFSNDINKKIKFDYKNFKTNLIPAKYHLLIKEALIQLVRNSISHGIETPEERKKLKKPQYGIIEVSTFRTNGIVGIRLRDDGRGIQTEKLKEKALQSGKWKADEINNWDDEQLAKLIFLSGITTADKIDMVAGRGVGMDGVKHRIQEHKGDIHVYFSKGKYCEFEINLPAV